MNEAVAAIESRIAEIRARFMGAPTAAASSGADFSRTLASVGGGVLYGGGPSTATGGDVITAAERYLGVPYKWGGTDPGSGLDCSGFVQRVFGDVGIQLPRVAADQATVGTPVAGLGVARPGDLVAFGSPVDHIGIYVGNGQMIVAPKTGDVVKIETITKTPTAIRRVLPDGTASLGTLLGARPAWLGGLGHSAGASATNGGAAPYMAMFRSAESRYGLPTGLLQAVARVESSFNPGSVSGAGAQGLMQLMPDTAQSLGVNPFDPAQAIDGAARLLAGHLQRFGSIDLALAAYNAGGNAVAQAGGIPNYPETQAYVQKVLSSMNEVAS